MRCMNIRLLKNVSIKSNISYVKMVRYMTEAICKQRERERERGRERERERALLS